MFPIFHFDSKTDTVIIDNAIMLEIPCFKRLWNRLKRGKNDSDGRDKVYNRKDLLYVYFMANISKKNPYRSLNEVVKDEEAKKACEFEIDWKPDALITECIEAYKDFTINYTPTAKFVVEVEQTIMQCAEHIKNIREMNERLLEGLKEQTQSELTDRIVVEAYGESMKLVNNNLTMLFHLLGEVESANKKRATLEKLVREEEAEIENRVTGGRKLGNREG